MAWFTGKPFLWKAAFVILTVLWIGGGLFIPPEIWRLFNATEPSLAVRLGGLAFLAISAAPIYVVLFLLAKAPPVALRLGCAFAILSWTGFSAVSAMFVVTGDFDSYPLPMALPGLCAAALAACVAIDLFKSAKV